MLPYLNPALTVEERTGDLLSRMTPEEKIGQLCKIRGFNYSKRNGNTYTLTSEFKEGMKNRPYGIVYGILRADWWTGRNWENGVPPENIRVAVNLFQEEAVKNTRLGIPFLLMEEAPHGLMALGTTVFPTGLGMGATWDAGLLERIGEVIGRECMAATIHSPSAPILDLALDPRWSRVEECFSEDPHMVTRMAEEMTRGMLRTGVNPTLKHYVGGGASEGGHNAFNAHLGEIELHNKHLRPFKNCIRAGAKVVMSTYHEVDGIPCTGSYRLLTEILRDELGFKGFVTADAGNVELMAIRRLAEDNAAAGAMAVKAGADSESGHENLETTGANLAEAYRRGLLSDADLDLAVGRVLKVKFELGIFEHPYVEGTPELIVGCRDHREVALETSRKSMTLLKNDGILPLQLKSGAKIAIIGPNADNLMNMLGDYSAPQQQKDVITAFEGIKKEADEMGVSVVFAPGCRIRSRDKSGFPDAIECAKNADAVILVLGGCSTKFGSVTIDPVTGATQVPIASDEENDKESGEGTDRATLVLSGVQSDLFQELKKTGKPVVVVLIQGRPLLINELMDDANAILLAWYPGMFGGQAIAEVLFGKYNPAGRLPISIPENVGQLPVFYNINSPSRAPYIDSTGNPRLPFGYGLSYTTFGYSNMRIDGRKVQVDVTNTGNRAGEEVVQFYLTDMVSSILRPYRELCGFSRVFIPAGETRTVQCELSDEVLGYYDQKLNFVVEPGLFTVAAGGSLDTLIETQFRLK
ncbi:MAG: glycoside hydrolase family 3 C-terminal domain-containing protein [Victivallales bacterium]|jgi:beta-glucosidase|nr:glycoside hydrolase family 3 C-terminal domain-containing protein [Victivallales bacterium]